MSGDEAYRAVLADCERALGRPDVALRLVAEALADRPDPEEAAELRLVEAGARRDLGESAAARLVLEDALGGRPDPGRLTGADPARIRLAAAYADLLEAEGHRELADSWRDAVQEADPEGATGALEQPQVEFAEVGDEADADAADGAVEDESPAGEPADEVTEADVTDENATGIDLPGEDVDDDDIEAEVAELLGEDPPQR
jgi:tetratricopeptide (TPR) repeat protein